MKLAESSKRNLQIFFREILADENFNLPAINFYAGKFSGIFTSVLQVHGITFGRHVFIQPDLIKKDFENRRTISGELAAHEIAHVLQYRKEGFVKFFYAYLKNYRQNLRAKPNWNAVSKHEAYREIPFEREAREIAAAFVEWNQNKKSTG